MKTSLSLPLGGTRRRPPGRCSRLPVAALCCLAAALLDPTALQAVPAAPVELEVTQPPPVGSVFTLRLRGDEIFSWHETSEGYAVVHDPAEGCWKYAYPELGAAAFRMIPEARVGAVLPGAYGLRPHALPEAALKQLRIEQTRALRAAPAALEVPENGPGQPATPVPGLAALPPPSMIPVSGTKTIRNIVLLACFSNHWNSGAGTVSASYGRVAASEYTNLFNQVNHMTDGAVGSLRDYFTQVSYSKLTVESVVHKWVRLPQTESYYGTDGASQDTNWKLMISNAIEDAESTGFDFSQGDSDGDGWVDCLTVIHSGHGQEITGNPSTCIWSKQGEMDSVLTKDGLKMKRAHTEPALRGLTSSTSIIRIGVICHEMGHFFGLPDLYDYSNATDGIGNWGLMGFGSWNGTDGKSPAHLSAYSKCMLGFAQPTTAHSKRGVSLARVEDNASVLLLRDGMTNGEYFLLENRARWGFDNDTSKIFPGLVIYHIDSKSANNDLWTWAHPLVKIEEADGDNSLGTIESPTPNRSESGDVWSSTNGLAGGFRDQTGNQTANSMRYQATAYSRADNAGYYSYLRVTNFSAPASTMSCDIQTLKTTVSNQTSYSTGYAVAWIPSSQATQYEIQEGFRATLTNFADGAESEDPMYANWHLAGGVKRSTAGKASGSYSYLLQIFDGYDWYQPVQSLTLQKPFRVTTGSSIAFYLTSHLHADAGHLKCQISKDGGNTWYTLGTYNGYINTWTAYTYAYAALTAKGIYAGDSCVLRFVMNTEQTYGWSGFPDWGFGLDDITLTGVEIDGYSGWTTLTNNVTATSYVINPRTSGTYAYRVQGYANSAWQGYGTEGEVTVVLPSVTLSLAGSLMAEAGAMAIVTATLSQTSPLAVVVDLAVSGTAVETNDYTVSAVPHTIIIPSGSLSGWLTLTAVQDAIDETNETIIVDISSVLNGEELGSQQVTATIWDDDPTPGSFEEWAQTYCPGMDLPTAFTNDYDSDGVRNGFHYAFGSNLATNEPLLAIFMLTNTPVIDIPKQLTSSVAYVDILIATKTNLAAASWDTNVTTHAIDHASEPTNRSWHVPDAPGSNGFFRLHGYLK